MENSQKKIYKANKLDQTLFILLEQTRETNHQAVTLELQHIKIHVSEARVLHILSREKGSVTLNQISNWTLRNLNSVLILINNMEKKGLVKKYKPEESRKVLISITEKGKQTLDSIPEKFIAMLFSDLTKEEKKQLKEILKKVRARGMELLGLNFKPAFLP